MSIGSLTIHDDPTSKTAPTDISPVAVYPAKDGTTYVVVGSGGRPRCDWSGSVESDRNFIALDVVPARRDRVDDPAGDQRTRRGVRPRRVQAIGQALI
jgi:hypothetical protein